MKVIADIPWPAPYHAVRLVNVPFQKVVTVAVTFCFQSLLEANTASQPALH